MLWCLDSVSSGYFHVHIFHSKPSVVIRSKLKIKTLFPVYTRIKMTGDSTGSQDFCPRIICFIQGWEALQRVKGSGTDARQRVVIERQQADVVQSCETVVVNAANAIVSQHAGKKTDSKDEDSIWSSVLLVTCLCTVECELTASVGCPDPWRCHCAQSPVG